MTARDLSYVSALRDLAEVEGACMAVQLGARAPFSATEADALERRARLIGGPGLREVVAMIRARAA